MEAPSSYLDYREIFLELSQNRNFKNSHEPFLNEIDGTQNLFMDIVSVGKIDSPNALVVLSGVHGVEGYCGSTIQSEFLRLCGAEIKIPSNVCIYLVHAVNPYGFHNERRTNEDNIDVNRNFRDKHEYSVDNVDYKIVHASLCPSDWSASTKNETEERLEKHKNEMGVKRFVQAIASGQSEFSDGLFYSGKRETWSLRTLNDWKSESLPKKKNICIIDIHTGLGDKGKGQLQTSIDPAGEEFRRLLEWFGSVYNPRQEQTEGVEVPYRHTGSVTGGIAKDLSHSIVSPVVLEFGTLSIDKVLHALCAENCLHHFGPFSEDQDRIIRNEFRDAFFPNEETWRDGVRNRGVEVIRSAIYGLAAL